jgi:hypothetical protein
MKNDSYIPGGYILYARDFLDLLEEAPLLDRVLWTWMNCRANHKDGDAARGQLGRGQLLATIPEMQRALRHRAGQSPRTPSKAAVWRALQRYRRRRMIETRRTTRGLVITICQYKRYQNAACYARHSKETAQTRRAQQDRHEQKNVKKQKGSPSRLSSCSSKTFAEMDRERAAAALVQAQEEFLADEQA